jgi:hypothetical protein
LISIVLFYWLRKKNPNLSIHSSVDPTGSLKHLYTIPKREFDEIQQEIIADYTVGKIASDSPVVVILGGQPGARKTELERITRVELGNNVISCNADVFRDYHPQVERIKHRHEAEYPAITVIYLF